MVLQSNQSSYQVLFENRLLQHNRSVVIFGSEFSANRDSTLHLFSSISLIRRSMERGDTVVLLYLEKLHECLYDMLNQQYTVFGHKL